jgi:hypothetical protein
MHQTMTLKDIHGGVMSYVYDNQATASPPSETIRVFLKIQKIRLEIKREMCQKIPCLKTILGHTYIEV